MSKGSKTKATINFQAKNDISMGIVIEGV